MIAVIFQSCSWLQVCSSCALGPILIWFTPEVQSREAARWCMKKASSIKSGAVCSSLTGRGWARPGSRPRALAWGWSLEKQYVFLSSLRALCLSLAITVCHATERHGHTLFLPEPSLYPVRDGSALPHTLSPSERGNMSCSSAHVALKRPSLPPGGTSALPLPIDQRSALLHSSPYSIYLSSHLSTFPFVSSLYRTSVCTLRASQQL